MKERQLPQIQTLKKMYIVLCTSAIQIYKLCKFVARLECQGKGKLCLNCFAKILQNMKMFLTFKDKENQRHS